ncbi:MAG: NAD(+)/NADH kinase [Thermomicrobiales bacterium]|nr:NAD(+)/NADH kinase [Thermomicrobiales bacterium]
MTAEPLVGIIANPASGKDIRRLVAHGSTFDNNEKINIVRRVLLGLDAAGVERVTYLPDGYGIVERAAAAAKPRLALKPLAMPVIGHASDSTEAAARLADLGAGVIVTLGGDGTNRAVAKSCGDVPLVAVSTGTNNVFPRMIEGTLAGLAAGLVASGIAQQPEGGDHIVRRAPRLVVRIDDAPVDIALIDVVTSTHAWLGARALWEPGHLREIVLSRITPAAIGIASLGSALFPEASESHAGAWIAIGSEADAPFSVTVPIAPGLMRAAPIAGKRLIEPGANVTLQSEPCTIALDGEREIEFRDPSAHLSVTFDPHGPRVVDVEQAIRAGALAGAFRTSPAHAS